MAQEARPCYRAAPLLPRALMGGRRLALADASTIAPLLDTSHTVFRDRLALWESGSACERI
jgi:hypothetical protein